MQTRDIYFKYERQAFGPYRSIDKFPIDSFCFDGESEVYSHEDFSPREVEGQQYVKLFCRCGACDFNDDGRFMHEYQCNCCGKYITVYRRTNHGEEIRNQES